MVLFLLGVGIFFLILLLLGVGIYQAFKIFFPDEKDSDYLEYYTTDGRPREEVFPELKDFQPAR